MANFKISVEFTTDYGKLVSFDVTEMIDGYSIKKVQIQDTNDWRKTPSVYKIDKVSRERLLLDIAASYLVRVEELFNNLKFKK